MRLMSRCTRPSTAPVTSVRIATAHKIGCQSNASVWNEEKKTRNNAAKPPTLAIAAMKPVAGVGAPW